jgi:hypothetical protein
MENKYIYIDESGDTGYTKKSTKYFILTAVMVDNPFVLRRIAKSVYKTKIDKEKSNMLHAYSENRKTKNILIKKLNNTEIQCVAFVLDKTNIHIKDPYLYLLEQAATFFFKLNVYSIILARKDTRNRYNKYIVDMFMFHKLNLQFFTPTSEKSLQIADFYSWLMFSYFEYSYSEYYSKLENHITIYLDKAKPSKNLYVDHQGSPSSRV